MGMITVNYLAILTCGIISMVLGSLWYGPLFGKPWMKMMGISKGEMTPEVKKAMIKSYSLMFIGSLVTAYMLSFMLTYVMAYTQTSGALPAAEAAFWTWLGFVAPVTMGNVLWEGKSWKLWLINNGYTLLFLITSAVILSLWV